MLLCLFIVSPFLYMTQAWLQITVKSRALSNRTNPYKLFSHMNRQLCVEFFFVSAEERLLPVIICCHCENILSQVVLLYSNVDVF